MSNVPISILALTGDAFVRAAAAHGVARAAAIDVYRDVMRRGSAPPEWVRLPDAPIVDASVEERADAVGPDDDPAGAALRPTKFIQRFGDGLESESVILPQRSRAGRARTALCVSSQVGCAMGCSFCETARMGLLRNLTAEEIVAQWHAARFAFGADVGNVVFMGMGEPLDNLDAVEQAIRVLADRDGAAVAPARIAVSTVGRPDGIRRLATLAREDGFRRLRLAVSVNAPNDAIRSSIMPINRAAPLAELLRAMQSWPSARTRPILIEYVLIPGVNDAAAHARELAAHLAHLSCTVNVIPYNPMRDSPWPAPAEADVELFIAALVEAGCFVKRRRTIGRALMAACGQLGNPGIRRRSISDQ